MKPSAHGACSLPGAYDPPAGDLATRAAGRLRGEVIHTGVDDDRSADDLADRKAIRQKDLKRVPVIGEKRREVSRVSRMRTFFRVIMRQGVGKRVCAVPGARPAAVDVEGKKAVFAVFRCLRQAGYFRKDQYAAPCLAESHRAGELRVFLASPDCRPRVRTAAQRREQVHRLCRFYHNNQLLFPLPSICSPNGAGSGIEQRAHGERNPVVVRQ